MMLQISEEAARFYKNEMGLKDGDCVKLFVQYGGLGVGGYALGVEKDQPKDGDMIHTVEGITFFSCSDDLWFTSQLQMDWDPFSSDVKLSLIS